MACRTAGLYSALPKHRKNLRLRGAANRARHLLGQARGSVFTASVRGTHDDDDLADARNTPS
jgi:hypothetical protein